MTNRRSCSCAAAEPRGLVGSSFDLTNIVDLVQPIALNPKSILECDMATSKSRVIRSILPNDLLSSKLTGLCDTGHRVRGSRGVRGFDEHIDNEFETQISIHEIRPYGNVVCSSPHLHCGISRPDCSITSWSVRNVGGERLGIAKKQFIDGNGQLISILLAVLNIFGEGLRKLALSAALASVSLGIGFVSLRRGPPIEAPSRLSESP